MILTVRQAPAGQYGGLRAESLRTSSSASRDLPIPASPTSVTRRSPHSAVASPNAASIAASSRLRPNGSVESPRNRLGVGSHLLEPPGGDRRFLPLSSSGPTGSQRAGPRHACVPGPSRISPGAADCSSRAATLTCLPSRIPLCHLDHLRGPHPCRSRCGPAVDAELVAKRCKRVANGFRGLCWHGAHRPHGPAEFRTAINASPTNFSTVPPRCSIAVLDSSKYALFPRAPRDRGAHRASSRPGRRRGR